MRRGNLNAKQSGTDQRQTKGVWHMLEIRMVGQQYTVLIDGRQVNQWPGPVRSARISPCTPGAWRNARTADVRIDWYRANRIGPEHPRYEAPSQIDWWSSTEPADPRYGTQPLPVLGRLHVGSGRHYRPTADDVGKLVYCQVSATNDGATVWETASARAITQD